MIAQPDVVLLGRRVAADQAFVWLAAGTIVSIALASYLEEFVLKALPNYDFFFTMAFFELAVFGVVSHVTIRLRAATELASLGGDGTVASPGAASGPPPRWSDVKWWRLEPRSAPLRLYAIGAACLALYASLGKLAYKYVNYVTGTVLKSIKLVPVMIVSVAWLGRSFPPHDYAAAGFLTASAVMFGLGEAESNPEADYALGFALSFVCLGLTAAQSNIADACMRDHGAGVDENMLYVNGFGAGFVLAVLVTSGEIFEAFRYFARFPGAFALLFVRSVVFYVGAWLYTLLMKHFGAVAAVAVTTARKAVTVMLSFALFRSDKPLTAKYVAATALFFGAIACEYHKSEVRRRREQREERARGEERAMGAKGGGRRGGGDTAGDDTAGDDGSGDDGTAVRRPGRRSADGWVGGATRGMDRELAPVRIK